MTVLFPKKLVVCAGSGVFNRPFFLSFQLIARAHFLHISAAQASFRALPGHKAAWAEKAKELRLLFPQQAEHLVRINVNFPLARLQVRRRKKRSNSRAFMVVTTSSVLPLSRK